MACEELWNGVSLHYPDGSFRLGTDSVVLADFALPVKGGKICDLGCGTGAIALMLLASDEKASAVGVELQAALADAAKENAVKNGLCERLSVVQGDLREIRSLLPANGFTCVVANPPYFPADSLPPKDQSLAISRMETYCTPDDLCAAASWLLTSGGRFCMVHRPERLADLICALRSHQLEPKTIQFVRHKAESKRSLVLIEAVRDGKVGLACPDDLILYTPDGSPTADCRRIYHKEALQ